jgi:HlyD family secretion protein
MKKNVLRITVIILAAAIVLLILKSCSKKADDYTFDTVKVEKGDIQNTVTATGTIEAVTTVQVGTQVSGIIEHVYVDFNDNVKVGQVLARLDETALRAQLEQSQAQVDQAQAQLTYQEATYNRLKALFEKNLIAQADYDQALYNYQNSRASLSNANSALDRAKVNLAYATICSPIDGVVLNRAIEEGQTVAASFNTPEMFTIAKDLTQMEVQTSVDEADIGKVKEGQRVEFTVDAYPDDKFEGTVSQVRLQPVITNNVVTYNVILNAPNPEKKLMPGMTASATMFIEEKQNTLRLSGKAMRFTPDQEYMMKMMAKMIKKMPEGQVPSSQGFTSSSAANPRGGTTGQIAAASGPEGSGFPAAIPDLNSLPGMEGKKMVWIRDEKAGLRPVPVSVGIDNGSSVEILSGLKEGDEVIISMNSMAKKESSSGRNAGQGGPPMPF